MWRTARYRYSGAVPAILTPPIYVSNNIKRRSSIGLVVSVMVRYATPCLKFWPARQAMRNIYTLLRRRMTMWEIQSVLEEPQPWAVSLRSHGILDIEGDAKHCSKFLLPWCGIASGPRKCRPPESCLVLSQAVALQQQVSGHSHCTCTPCCGCSRIFY